MKPKNMKKSTLLLAALIAAAVLFVSCGNSKIYGKWERDDGVVYEFSKDYVSMEDGITMSATYKRSGGDIHVVFNTLIPMSMTCHFTDNDTMQVNTGIGSFELVRIK